MDKFFETQAKHEQTLRQKTNVIGVGIGKKITQGQLTDVDCLVVYVTKKLPLINLKWQDFVPKYLDNVPTDVVEVGEVRALLTPTDKWRPAPPGVSIGHYHITAGTFGAVVIDKKTGKRVILSNNHVLANSNKANIGDAILQPGVYDGGMSEDKIGELLRYVPIDFSQGGGECNYAAITAALPNLIAKLTGSKTRLVPQRIRQSNELGNTVDAAIALPISDGDILDNILNIGYLNGIFTDPPLNHPIQKSGRSTGHTTGTVTGINLTIDVGYGENQVATFTKQFATGGAMSAPGDSGSLIVDMQNRAVGLLFAGSDAITIFNPISEVRDKLEIEI